MHDTNTAWSKNWHIFVRLITSSNTDQFSNLFTVRIRRNFCNNIVTKDPNTPHMCRYTALSNVNGLKQQLKTRRL